MNSYLKWLIVTLFGIILAGAGWNETRQWDTSDTITIKTNKNAEDIAALKQIAIEIREASKDNNKKLDKLIEQRK